MLGEIAFKNSSLNFLKPEKVTPRIPWLFGSLYCQDSLCFEPLLFHINMIAEYFFSFVYKKLIGAIHLPIWSRFLKFAVLQHGFKAWNLSASAFLFSCPFPTSSTSITVNSFPPLCRVILLSSNLTPQTPKCLAKPNVLLLDWHL